MQSFISKSYGQTVELGKKLGKKLKKGDTVAFFGSMGMGKTAFVTGIAEGMGLDCEVSSPTFAIVNVYGKNSELCHFDMYRVSSWDDLYSTGFFEYMDMGSVICIEWSENIENAVPEDAIKIYIEKGADNDERIIKIDGCDYEL
ncbi:MAG: tRNA (adenosine(37)-N6)-threonylcarbamoyltransferase complex ATPase subunit type 1 TsaE [Ruminococcaceae bacterium]|nr:tRNA (adenosine(37)-N6)-threonylcarbamoyltransferase complex ATPase subunit type 1 TsaE [Oscillospiraceae bacterium]